MSQPWNPIRPTIVPLNSPKAEGHYGLPGLGTMDRGGALKPIRQSHEQIFSFFVLCCLMLRSGRLLLEKGAPLSCTASWPVLRQSPNLHVGLQGVTENIVCKNHRKWSSVYDRSLCVRFTLLAARQPACTYGHLQRPSVT